MEIFKLAIVISGLLFLIGLFGLFKKVRLSSPTTVIAKKIFIVLGSILIIAGIIAQFDTYLRGYWTTKSLIWLFIIIASLLFAFGDRQIVTRRWRIFTGLIFYFPSASVLLFFIVPFMGPVLTISIWGRILGDKGDIFYNDNDIRLQRVFKGALGPAGPPNYFKKNGILEFDKGILAVNF